MSWGILINFHIDFWSSYKLRPFFKFLSENSFVVGKRIIAIAWVFKMSFSMLAMYNVKKKNHNGDQTTAQQGKITF